MLDYSQIELNNINLDDPDFDEQNNCFRSSVRYLNKDLTFKTASMRLVEKRATNIDLEFLSSEPYFYETMSGIDLRICDVILEKGEEWFEAKLSRDTITTLFRKTIKLPKTVNSMPYMTMNISKDVLIEDKNKKNVTLDKINLNTELTFILKADSVVFFNNGYNLVYKVEKIHVQNYFCAVNKCLFDTESSGSESGNSSVSNGDDRVFLEDTSDSE